MNLARRGDLLIRSKLEAYDDFRVSVVTITVFLREDSAEHSHKEVVRGVLVQRRQRIGRPIEVVPLEPILWVVEDDASVQTTGSLCFLHNSTACV
jgi:hypothetical protein